VDNVLSEPILPTLSRRPILNTLLFVWGVRALHSLQLLSIPAAHFINPQP
jgi:hypothetical protein